MRCHLSLLAVLALLSLPQDTAHEYDPTISALALLSGERLTPLAHIIMYHIHRGFPLAICLPALLLFHREPMCIFMRQAPVLSAVLCFLHLLVALWSYGAGGRDVRYTVEGVVEGEKTAAMSVCCELDTV